MGDQRGGGEVGGGTIGVRGGGFIGEEVSMRGGTIMWREGIGWVTEEEGGDQIGGWKRHLQEEHGNKGVLEGEDGGLRC